MMKRIFYILAIFAAVFLAGLFLYLKNQQELDVSRNQNIEQEQSIQAAQEPTQAKVFDVVIKNRILISLENNTIQVIKGDEVILKITSDEAGEFHLHGYGLSAQLFANEPAEIKFEADIAGRFEFEGHEFEKTLGAVEVLPN